MQEILSQLEASNDQKARIGIFDIDGVLRGKLIHISKLKKALQNGFGFCNVVFGWDINDLPYENGQVSGWHTGYPDALARLDPNTFRRIPWEEQLPFFLGDFQDDDSGLAEACPRTLLTKIRQECLELGFTPKFSGELEWFNFKETPQSFADKDHQNPKPLTPGMFGYSVLRSAQNRDFFHSLFDQLHAFDIPVEGIHTETGDGVYEACIVYGDILEAADRMALFKTSVKELSYHYGQMASFMAKWNNDLPGCSGHLHQSLWNDANENAFYDGQNEVGISSLMQSYIAGQLHCLPYLLPMYAPTINSYKRLVVGSWASVSASWGIENRTTALRVISAGADSTRLETRVPGADANPYLSMAAALASGLYGIKKKMKLDVAPTKGNEYTQSTNVALSKNLGEAIEKMKSSELPQELFGEGFVDHFIRTRAWEWQQFQTQVTNWELKRYFELI